MNMLIAKRDKMGTPVVAILRGYPCSCKGFHFGSVKGAINWDVVANYKAPPPKQKKVPAIAEAA